MNPIEWLRSIDIGEGLFVALSLVLLFALLLISAGLDEQSEREQAVILHNYDVSGQLAEQRTAAALAAMRYAKRERERREAQRDTERQRDATEAAAEALAMKGLQP